MHVCKLDWVNANMTHKIVNKMFEEYGDFKEYMKMYEACTDISAKAVLKKIIDDEMHHYKHLYDLVFANVEKAKMTDIELAVHEYATHLYHEMSECITRLK